MRFACAGGDRLHRNFDHRRDEGGRDTVPGDIGHQYADPAPIDGDEFIEVPSYSGHRKICGVNVKSFDLRNAVGENGVLDVPGDGQFFLNGEQAS